MNSEAVLTLMRQGWGQENPAFRQLFTSLFIPGGSTEQMQWYNDLQRITTSPENAVRLRQVVDEIDVTDLPNARHGRGRWYFIAATMRCNRSRKGRIAAGIPGARFVALEGSNHIILESDPGWSRLLHEINIFLKG
jgi:hypothetical protein